MSLPSSVINISTVKAATKALCKAAIDAVNAVLPDVDVFYLDGEGIPRAALLQMIADRITAAENTRAARLAFHEAIDAERAVDKRWRRLSLSLKMYVQTRFGKGSPQVQAFGFTQTKRRRPSAATAATAVQKAEATRKARHTMGPKQKKRVKGTLNAAAGDTQAHE